jgi:hypothetical protein
MRERLQMQNVAAAVAIMALGLPYFLYDFETKAELNS